MPNFKVFQDTANDLRVKIYGADDLGNVQPLLTNASGIMTINGDVAVSGNVGVSGVVTLSGSSVAVSGPVEISGNVGVSGTVTLSGSSVAVSGNVGVSGVVTLSGHTIVDFGPVQTYVNSGGAGESGVVSGGTFDVMSYSSWTLAVKYSGTSGEAVTVRLEMSALSGGEATSGDYLVDSSGNFATENWLFFTAGITPRYARLYYVDASTDSGSLYHYFQAQN